MKKHTISIGVVFLILISCAIFWYKCTNTEEIVWPQGTWISDDFEFQGAGNVVHTFSGSGYADGTGIYNDVNQWQIYYAGTTIFDLSCYIDDLKNKGFSYVGLDGKEEPEIAFDWTNTFLWRGMSDEMSVMIIQSKSDVLFDVPGSEKNLEANLLLMFIDDVVWER